MLYLKKGLRIFAVRAFFIFIAVMLSFFFAWLVKFTWGRLIYGIALTICYASVVMSEAYTAASDDSLNLSRGALYALPFTLFYTLAAAALLLCKNFSLLRLIAMPYSLLLPLRTPDIPFLFFGFDIPFIAKGAAAGDVLLIFFGVLDLLLCIAGYALGRRKINFKQRLLMFFKYGTNK